MFSIYDGRQEFYQWDKDRKLIVNDSTIKQVHFCNKTDDCSLVCDTYTEGELTLVNVPNILLQSDWKIRVYGFTGDYTKHEACFKVNSRTKPADYIYTEVEYWTVEKAVTEALEEAKASGAFKGEKGDKGEAGAVKMVVVTELPTTGEEDAIYLLPKEESEENNNFSEYVFTNGAWECIGSAGVQVNLDEYVKKTDYPDEQAKAGVVKVNPTDFGIGAYPPSGVLYITPADKAQIDAKTHNRRPITPHILDYAVKSGLAASKEEWTEEEKQAARDLVGAIGVSDYATDSKAGLVKANPIFGIYINPNSGVISVINATNKNIDDRASHYPVTGSNLDYAVKSGLTTNNQEWTEEEKQAARDLVGAAENKIATTNDIGLVRCGEGLYMSASSGKINLAAATNQYIDAKSTNGRAITPACLDYAVKVGLTTNTETLTDEEKQAALEWLGVNSLIAELTARIEALEGKE